MTKFAWDEKAKRHVEFGVSRGVLYPKDGGGIYWNGLEEEFYMMQERVVRLDNLYYYQYCLII